MINIQGTFWGNRSGSRRNRNKIMKNGGGKGRERERAMRRSKMSHHFLSQQLPDEGEQNYDTGSDIVQPNRI